MKRRAGRLAFRLAVFAACALYPLSGFAQRRPADGRARVSRGYHGTAHSGARALRFASVSEAEAAVDRILKVVGLTRNFVIEASHDVDNAESGIDGNNRRYIYYNPAFMERITSKAQTDWAALAIMAHEIGHHLLGHRIENEGQTPQEERAIRHRQEFEADRFSGFILRYLGASVGQAQSAVEAYGEDGGSPTHPPMRPRLDAIRGGWGEANGIITSWVAAGAGQPARPPPPRPETTPERPRPPTAPEPPRARGAWDAPRISADNTSTRLSGNRWEWTVFINAPPEVLEQVSDVVYELHPTFRPSAVRVRERGVGRAFALKAVGWGVFEMKIHVLMKDGRRYELAHRLKL